MDLLLIGAVALLAAGLTLFSGFGLGTLLMPVFALFFPVPVAIAATAVVHLANNVFKFALLARQADWNVAARFGVPAALAALAGAAALHALGRSEAHHAWFVGPFELHATFLKAVIGSVIVVFAVLELWPPFSRLEFPATWLGFGGALSGFFGGLSGNQGALRSAFLVKSGLDQTAFVATGVVCAVLVDVVRLGVYGMGPFLAPGMTLPVLVAIACAFIGSYGGKRLLPKVTLALVQGVVAASMVLIGAALALGAL